jgi:HlyD family secretion protein
MSTLLPAVIDFQSDARKIDERRPPWVARATLYVLVAVIIIASIWAAVAEVDRIVVAPGKLVTTASTIVVQPLETSTVRSLHARMGDIVRKGDALATLDPTFSEADAGQLRGKVASLAAQTGPSAPRPRRRGQATRRGGTAECCHGADRTRRRDPGSKGVGPDGADMSDPF